MDGASESPGVIERAGLYGVNMIPHSAIGGSHSVVGAGDGTYGVFMEYYNQVLAIDSPLNISIELDDSVEDFVTATASVEVLSEITSTNNNIILALTLHDGSEYSSIVVGCSENIDFELTQVGETATYECEFELDFHWNLEDLKVVAIVQNWFTPKNVIQGAQVDLVYQTPNPVTPGIVDFGTTEVGETVTRQISVTNYWEEQLTGTITSATGFSIADTYTVGTGETINLDIEFSPTNHNVYNDDIIFTTNQTEFPEIIVEVKGIGYTPETGFWEEDFSLNQFPPIGWMLDEHPYNWTRYESSNAGGTSPEIMFTSSPVFEGTSRLASIPMNLENGEDIWIEFNHSLDVNSSGIQIGVATRADFGEWSSIWESSTGNDIDPQNLRVPVTNSDASGNNFQVCWYLTGNTDNLNYWYIDDIKILQPLTSDLMLVEVVEDTYFEVGDVVNPIATIRNIGMNVEVFDLVYEVYRNDELLHTQTIADMSAQINEFTTIQFDSFALEFDNELYQLQVYIDSDSDMNLENNTFSKYVNTYAIERQFVVLEMGTATSCGYCPYAAMGAEEMVEAGHDIAVIEYHSGDDYSNDAAYSRMSYYSVTGLPTAIFDGLDYYIGIQASGQSMYPDYLQAYNARKEVKTSLQMGMVGSQNGNDFNMEISLLRFASMANENLALHLVLTESNIPEEWQDEEYLHYVERLMIPNENGTSIDLVNNSTQTVNLDFTMDETWDMDSCELVAFVQDNDTKEILQGIKLDLNELTSSEENQVSVPAFKLMGNYPNPFNPTTTISFSTAGSDCETEVTIFNIKGQKIKSLLKDRLEAGNHNIVWDGRDDNENSSGSGIYLYQIKSGSETKSAKMILIK